MKSVPGTPLLPEEGWQPLRLTGVVGAVTGFERSELFPPCARMIKEIKRAYAREPVTAFPVLTR